MGSTRELTMSDPINSSKTKLMKSPPRSSHDDSGFVGLNSAEKVHDEKVNETLSTSSPQTKDFTSLFSYYPDPASKSDQFWSTAVNCLMLVVVGASVCYMVLMGDQVDIMGEAQVKLGGRRAAIQFYYDSQMGVEN